MGWQLMKNLDQNENDLLGICIPTYNRAVYLDKCLYSITENFRKYGFPIYVSDNCSEDDTESIVDYYHQSYSNIVYIKNKSNLGLYINILNAIEMASSKYIWLMGDDDAILPNSLERVIPKILDGNDYVVVNAVPYDINLQRTKLDRIINCSNDKKYGKGHSKNLLVDLKKWAYHGFISSMIIKTELILPIAKKYRERSFPLYNNIWFPLALFYEAIANHSGIFVCEPVVMNRDNPRASGKNFWNYMFIDHLKSLEYIGKEGYAVVNMRDFLKLIDVIFIATISKHKDPDTILLDEYIKKNKSFPYYLKLLLLFIDLIPKFLLGTLNDLICKLK